jgi:hypothetical protein
VIFIELFLGQELAPLNFLADVSNRVNQACKILMQETSVDKVAMAICDVLIDEIDKRLTSAIEQLEFLAPKNCGFVDCGEITSLKIPKRFGPVMNHQLRTNS